MHRYRANKRISESKSLLSRRSIPPVNKIQILELEKILDQYPTPTIGIAED